MRFITNLPREELESVERICFQVEEAQWFYEDFVRPLDPSLPSLNLRQFCFKIFQHCPLFSVYDIELHSRAFSEFLAYKTRVPVRGAILLNDTLDEVVLVKGYKKGASWSFPRGKINKDERDIDCAIREVYEETGYDIRSAGLISKEDDVKSIDITMREQHMKLFVFPGVPKDTYFEPKTRKEISRIEWYKLSDLPTLKKLKQQQQQNNHELAKNANKFYMVAPFLVPLKKTISQLKRRSTSIPTTNPQQQQPPVQKVQADHLSEPTMKSNTSSEGNDVERLMLQLRQSQQASRENNFPEVSEPQLSTQDASIQIKGLLNMHSAPPTKLAEDTKSTISRGNKAQAMLSLLRGTGTNSGVEPLPSTPLEQVTAQPSNPPPSPKNHLRQFAGVGNQASPQSFPLSSAQPATRQPSSDASIPLDSAVSVREVAHPQLSNPPSLLQHPQPHLYQPNPILFTTMSAKWSNGQPPAHNAQLPDERQIVAPPPSRLPLPKLTAHSSALLSLFKDGAMVGIPHNGESRKLPAEHLASTPELSASRPTDTYHPQSSANRPASIGVASSSSALASVLPGTPSLVSPRSSSQHQENLLNIFRSPPSLTGKVSPSLMPPPPAPVELAANQPLTQDPGLESQYHASTSSIAYGSETRHKRRLNESVDLTKPNLSATVTGPLNVPQFENIQRTSARMQHVTHKPKRSHTAVSDLQFPIKILMRPGSSHQPQHADMNSSRPSEIHRSPRESPRPQTRTQNSPKPFQPQILKRPTGKFPPVVQPMGESLRSEPLRPQAPHKILTRPVAGAEDSQVQPFDQKAALLSLFGRSNTNLSSSGLPMGLPVSPLSEKPAVDNDAASPTVVGRSRIGSIQSLEAEAFGSGRQTPKVIASPHDNKKFLLGFLDGVAREEGK